MSIRVECACGRKLSIKDEMAGRRVKCPTCENVLTVPKASAKPKSIEDDHDAVASDAVTFAVAESG